MENQLFFFLQSGRTFCRRQKRSYDEVPVNVKFGVGSKLRSKEIGSKLPKLKAGDIKARLLSIDDDSMKFVIDDLKMRALSILLQLARYLYRYHNINSILSNGLRYQLSLGWSEFAENAFMVKREWQTLAGREYYLLQCAERAAVGGIHISSSNIVLSHDSTPDKVRDTSTRPSTRLSSSKQTLPEISDTTKRLTSKSNASVISKLSSRRPSLINVHKKNTQNLSVIGETRHDRDLKSYYSLIQFIYSSKQARDKGWLVKKESEVNFNIRPTLEWCLALLKNSLKTSEMTRLMDKEFGRMVQPLIQYVKTHKNTKKLHTQKPVVTQDELVPIIPAMEVAISTIRPILRIAINDGSTIIYYPSGRQAIVKSHAGTGLSGFYVFTYTDSPDAKLLAVFTPQGLGTVYHDNGNIHFQSTPFGGHIAENNGCITRKWKWVRPTKKLMPQIIFQLSPHISFRCLAWDQMFLVYSSARDTLRVNVSQHKKSETEIHTETPSINTDQLLTNGPFTSRFAQKLAARNIIQVSRCKSNLSKNKGRRKTMLTHDQTFTKDNVQPHIAFAKALFEEEIDNLSNSVEKDLLRLQLRAKGLVDDWMEHYRSVIGVPNQVLTLVSSKPKIILARRTQSARGLYTNAVRSRVKTGELQLDDIKPIKRNLSAPAFFRRLKSGSKSTQHSGKLKQRKKVNKYIKMILHCQHRRATRQALSSCKQQGVAILQADFVCCVSLRTMMLGYGRQPCRCSPHFIPMITDVEYMRFIMEECPSMQLIIVFVFSSLFPLAHMDSDMMLSSVYNNRIKTQVSSCEGSRNDTFRLFKYDMATAAAGSDHSQPLLLTKHNVVPGMFLMYQSGNLLFCDHICNGYGNTTHDFRRQINRCRRYALTKNILPADFKFSPIKCRAGMRSAYGGEMGGAGVDLHGGVGTTLSLCNVSASSSTSTNPLELALETKLVRPKFRCGTADMLAASRSPDRDLTKNLVTRSAVITS